MAKSLTTFIAFLVFLFALASLDAHAETDPFLEAKQYQIAAIQVAEAQIEKATLEKRLAEAKQMKECAEKTRSLENELMYMKGRLDGIKWMLTRELEIKDD